MNPPSPHEHTPLFPHFVTHHIQAVSRSQSYVSAPPPPPPPPPPPGPCTAAASDLLVRNRSVSCAARYFYCTTDASQKEVCSSLCSSEATIKLKHPKVKYKTCTFSSQHCPSLYSATSRSRWSRRLLLHELDSEAELQR